MDAHLLKFAKYDTCIFYEHKPQNRSNYFQFHEVLTEVESIDLQLIIYFLQAYISDGTKAEMALLEMMSVSLHKILSHWPTGLEWP